MGTLSVCMMSRVARAELRLYAPVESFAPEAQAHWRAYAASGSRPQPLGLESASGAITFDALGRLVRAGDPHAYLAQRGGRLLVCPRCLHLRAARALLMARDVLPPVVASEVVDPGFAAGLAQDLAVAGSRHPQRVPVRDSAFHVPSPWFAAFAETDRRYEVDAGGVAGLRYESTVEASVARLRRAVSLLETAGLAEILVGAVHDVLAWVESFPAGSVLELDYGTVADLFPADVLADDHSVREVNAALDALARGDVFRAGLAYSAVTARWGRLRLLDHLS